MTNSTTKCHVSSCKKECFDKSLFCFEHTCVLDSCTGFRYNANFCAKHACFVDGCEQPSTDESNYCGKHRCIVSGCKNLVCTISEQNYVHSLQRTKRIKKENYFCHDHKCATNRCSSVRTDGYLYCMDCKCIVPECKVASIEDSMFCYAHKCRNNYCDRGCDADKRYCDECNYRHDKITHKPSKQTQQTPQTQQTQPQGFKFSFGNPEQTQSKTTKPPCFSFGLPERRSEQQNFKFPEFPSEPNATRHVEFKFPPTLESKNK